MDILFFSLLTNLLYYFTGKVFISHYKSDFNSQFYTYFKGLIIISFIALILNFFTKLSPIINTILFIIVLFFFLIKTKLKINNNELYFLIFSTLITFTLICFSTINRPDAGLYHLPYISLLNDYKIILGTTNIHFRFGHTSIMQYLSAINNNILFKDIGVVIPLASVVSFFYMYFLNDIWSVIKKKNLPNISNFFSLFIILYISFKLTRYSGFGNDAVPHLTLFYLVSYILKNEFKKISINKTLLISLFIFINKPTLAIVFIIPTIIFLIKENLVLKKLFNLSFSFPLIFLYLWLIKNLLISGCILYPVKLTCIDKLPWTDKTQIINVDTSSQAWSKGWPNRKNKNISMADFNKNFNWIEAWSSNHLKYILKIIIPYITVLSIITICIRRFYCSIKKVDNDLNNRILMLISTCFLGTISFFLIFPLYRYGYSYLISLVALLVLLAVKNYTFTVKSKNLFKYIFFISILLFSAKQFQKIYNNKQGEIWPNIYTLSDNKKINEYKIIKLKGDFVYYLVISGDFLCMYSKSPCTTYLIKDNVKHEKLLGYSSLNLNK